MNFNLLEKEGMIETLESGLLIIKPQVILSKEIILPENNTKLEVVKNGD